MDTESMSTMELIDTVEHNAYKELSRRPYNDPERARILNEAETCFKVKNGYEQTEQNRLNNYAKNETEDRKVDVELKKAKNDRARIRFGFAQGMMYLFGGFIAGILGYGLDTWYQKDRRLADWQKTCQNLAKPK